MRDIHVHILRIPNSQAAIPAFCIEGLQVLADSLLCFKAAGARRLLRPSRRTGLIAACGHTSEHWLHWIHFVNIPFGNDYCNASLFIILTVPVLERTVLSALECAYGQLVTFLSVIRVQQSS